MSGPPSRLAPPLGRALAAVAALALAACGEPDRPGVPPRHVVLVTVADLRADHVSTWLYPRATTARLESPSGEPTVAIDDLVRTGVMFARAFAPSAMQRPSLAALHTGRAPLELGVLDEDDPLPPDVPTLAEELSRKGFRTAAFVASAAAAEDSGLARGFETFACTAGEEDADREALRRALDWAGEAAARDPEDGLFLWLHLAGPAPPYDPAPLGSTDFAELFTDPHYEGGADGSLAWLEAVRAGEVAPSGEDVEHVVALYDGEIARVNALVRLFTLAWAGVLDLLPRDFLSESVLVIAGASGAELLQHGPAFRAEASLFDASLHVPLVLRHPPSLTGSRAMAEPVELADVARTLAEWLGASGGGLGGRSLLALVDSHVEREFDSRPAFGAWRDSAFTARSERWRLVWCPPRDGAGTEHPFPLPARALYDCREDPLERVDVAALHPDVAGELERSIRARLAAAGIAPSGGGAVER